MTAPATPPTATPTAEAQIGTADALARRWVQQLKADGSPLSSAQTQALDLIRQRALSAHAQQLQTQSSPTVVGHGSGSLRLGQGQNGPKAQWLYWALPLLLVLGAWLWLQRQAPEPSPAYWPQGLAQLDAPNSLAALDDLDMLDDDIPLAAYADAGFLQYLEQAAPPSPPAAKGAAG